MQLHFLTSTVAWLKPVPMVSSEAKTRGTGAQQFSPAPFHWLVAEQVKTKQLQSKTLFGRWTILHFCLGHFTSTLTKTLEFVWCCVLVRPCGCHIHCELLSNKEQMLAWCSVRALAGFIVSEGVLIAAECKALPVDRQHSNSTSPGLGQGLGVCAWAVRLCCCAGSLLMAAHPRDRYLQEGLGVFTFA